MYPALVNCTTIDLFNEWPQEALLEVGERYLANVNLEGNEGVNTIFYDDLTKVLFNKKILIFIFRKKIFNS